ncbi:MULTISPECIES: hypothetical protein [unclassified Sporosarcina]|uniref:hypothetical protein n=1 Tax=unclassified Sporosarcina TaxID=2647733 RepID=UPI0020418110|nr:MULTISPECIES: hypothetical protein [unclassified Sporosarcina]GKV67374.1 hypothetical protein NCCP2331_35270 [Sporosarcina sp. NCCP-2331]GLB57730.1 hypothetical protein NCCP2378_35200 [Sporosarcina sp. NCCP-2378]
MDVGWIFAEIRQNESANPTEPYKIYRAMIMNEGCMSTWAADMITTTGRMSG